MLDKELLKVCMAILVTLKIVKNKTIIHGIAQVLIVTDCNCIFIFIMHEYEYVGLLISTVTDHNCTIHGTTHNQSKPKAKFHEKL